MKHSAALQRAILDQLSIDVYSSQSAGRYLLTEVTLSAIAIACAAEFLRGFFDFAALGTATRERLVQLLADFHGRRTLDRYEDAGELTDLLDAVRRDLPVVTPAERSRGEASLTRALMDFGITPEDAEEHARKIAVLVTEALQNARSRQ
jgi:hypothetical protein